MPAIETPRLILSVHRPDDLGDCAHMWGDSAVTRFIGGTPATAEETWARLLRYAGQWALSGFGYWVIREKATHRFAGEAGLAEFRRDIQPSFDGAPEAGWALAPWAHGKGYATEALTAILAWADRNVAAERTVCMINPANAASIRLAMKHGYAQYASSVYKNTPASLFERKRHCG